MEDDNCISGVMLASCSISNTISHIYVMSFCTGVIMIANAYALFTSKNRKTSIEANLSGFQF